MRSKKYSCKQLAILAIAAGALVLPVATNAFSAAYVTTNVVRQETDGRIHIGSDSLIVDTTSDPAGTTITTSNNDDLIIKSSASAVNPGEGIDAVYIEGNLHVRPAVNTSTSSSSGAGGPGALPYILDNDGANNGSYFTYHVTNDDATSTTSVSSGGGAVISSTGDVHLSQGQSTISKLTYDIATRQEICDETEGCGVGNTIAQGQARIDLPNAGATIQSGIWTGTVFTPGFQASMTSATTSSSGGGSLTVDGTTTLNDTLYVAGHAEFESTVDIDGLLEADGGLEVTGLTSTDSLYVAGHAEFESTVDVDGLLEADGGLTVTGLTDTDSLYVSGHAEFESTVDVDGLLEADGGLTVTGMTDTDSLYVQGHADIGTLYVAGHAEFESTVDVDGLLEADGGLTVTGLTDLNGNLDVDAPSYINLQVGTNTTFINMNTSDIIIDADDDVHVNANSFDVDAGNNEFRIDGNGLNFYNSSTGRTILSTDNWGDVSVGDDLNVGDDLQVDDNANIDGNLDVGEDIYAAGNLEVDGTGDFHGTVTVSPLPQNDVTTVTPGGGATLPDIENDSTTSTVYTQTGSVEVVTETSSGGGVVLETNGNASLLRPDTGGTEVNYLQVTTFLVTNATGLPIAGTEEMVGGYLDGEGNFVELGPLDGNGLLDLSSLTEGQLAAISTPIEATDEGGNLLVEGDAQFDNDVNIDGDLTVGNDLDIADDLHVSDNATVDGWLDVGDDIYVEGGIHFGEYGGYITGLQDPTDPMDATNKRYVDREVKHVQDDVDDLDDRVSEVGALAAAFSAIVPNDRVSGNTQIGVGAGYYDSEGALAAGIFHYVNDNVLINAGVSVSFGNQEAAGRLGVTWGF